MDAYGQIANLEYRFIEALDQDLESIAPMFAHGTLEMVIDEAETMIGVGVDGAADVMRSITRPRPADSFGRHMATNLIVDLDDDGVTAHAWFRTTLFYVESGMPLHILGLGRHEDELRLVDGQWTIYTKRIVGEVRYPPPPQV